uniref:SprT-like domain-containing protein n=1 Tax=Angiostrongylus cantonensis TaxID=6313 RepID=A0A158P863_ANGCA
MDALRSEGAIDSHAVNRTGSREFPVDSQGGDDVLDDCRDVDLYFRPRSESPDMFRSSGRPSTFGSSYDGPENGQQHHDTAPTSPSHRLVHFLEMLTEFLEKFELSYEIEDSRDEVRSESGGVRSRGRAVRGRGRANAKPCSGSTTPLASSPLVTNEKKRSGSGFDLNMSRRGRGSKRGRAYGLPRAGETVEPEAIGVVSTSAADDVYEFRSSPEGEFSQIQPEFGNHDERERSAPPSTKRQRLGEARPDSQGGSAHSGDIEMDDIEDDECNTKAITSDRKVPPLRISLPITQSEEDLHGESTGHQLVLGHLSSATRKTSRGRHGKRQNDADDAQRMTRSKVRQTGKVLDDTDAWAKKKRGRISTALGVTGDEADESTADDTSPVGEGSEDTSTGQASNSASIPESLSSEQRIIYENPRSGMFHLKKLLAERWLADFHKEHQKHSEGNEKYKKMLLFTGDYSSRHMIDGSIVNQTLMKDTERKDEQPFPAEVQCCSPAAKEEADSEDESNGICSEMKAMWKEHNEERINTMNRMHKERIKLQLFWEQEFLRMEQREQRSTPLMSAVRFLRENEMCNAQILEEPTEPLKPMSREEFGERKNKSINQLYNRHKMEASSLFGLQRDMWWYEARRRGLDVNSKFIKDCVPMVKVEKVDFPY